MSKHAMPINGGANIMTAVVTDPDSKRVYIKSLVVGAFDPNGVEAMIAMRLSREMMIQAEGLGATRTADGAMVMEASKAAEIARGS